jgi:type VI secretion system protein VasG
MMRGLREKYEKSHGVRILDEAVVASAKLSNRYISGRQLPDKSVDLIDTAAARVRVQLGCRPDVLDDCDRKVATLDRSLDALQRDKAAGKAIDPEQVAELEAEIAKTKVKGKEIEERWNKEMAVANEVVELRNRIEALRTGEPLESNKGKKEEDQFKEDKTANELATLLEAKLAELKAMQGRDPLVHVEVNTDMIGKVVADWTGIPVGKMVTDEARTILAMDQDMKKRIRGQDHAIDSLSEVIRSAKAGVGNPNKPQGVFLLVGPSGVGKTETALTWPTLLFGGERFSWSRST